MHNGRPSSTASMQHNPHIINMAGMESGFGLGGGSSGGGGGGERSSSRNHPTMTSSGIIASAVPPGAYRSSPSSGHSPRPHGQPYSPHPPSSMSPQGGNPASLYSSPRVAQAVGPSTSTGHLGRSHSIGHSTYQQFPHSHGASQQPPLPLSAASSSAYNSAPHARSRDGHQQYSDGAVGTSMSSYSSTPKSGSNSLLPTINTQIPSGSLLGASAYSPTNNRHTIMFDSPSYAAMTTGGPPHSPSTAMAYGGAGASGASLGTRPMSMADPSFSLSPRKSVGNTGYQANEYVGHLSPSPMASGSSKRGSLPHLHSSSGLDQAGAPLALHSQSHASGSAYGESLPLYRSGSNQAPTSPYMPVSPGAKLGPPPSRTTNAAATGGIYPSNTNADRMSVDPMDMSHHLQRKERRGTVTSADAPGRVSLGEFEAFDRLQKRQPVHLEGFRRVRDISDLKIILEPAQQGKGRRADPSGGYVSPLKAMTAYLHHTYHLVNPAFFYELSFNPRRVLTKPSRPMHNDGHDNEDSDYILYVNDWLGTEEGNRYLILDILGQGTFGQVVKCQNMKTREIVAVKVIKNKPAYFNQSMMEVTILEMLNGNWDPNDEHHILRLRDTFIHAKHLCLVFELLSSNLYELIKQNSFRGLSTSLVRVFTTQLLDALTVLNEARLIHCDLKPENILLKTLQTPSIKLVDFGSACHERQTVYTYIQSRFYRSPEVLLGLPYNSAIDMWSLGCIAIELFLGLPLFPGTSEYNQVCRIVEMLGPMPQWMLEQGKQTTEFFNVFTDEYGRRQFKLKGLDQYSKEHNVQEQPSKRYFQATTLPDIVKTYPMSRKSGKPADVQKEVANRTSFIDFVAGLLSMDPNMRWTPQQAKLHPFITGEKFTQSFKPPLSPVNTIQRSVRPGGTDAAKHPYGGLPEAASARSTGRSYQDAAAYNQHLAQQQVYNVAHQAKQHQSHNPYARDDGQDNAHLMDSNAHAQAKAAATQAQLAHARAHAQAHAQAAQMHAAAMSPPYAQSGATSYSQNRSRSNTLSRMEVIPPQMAKMGLEPGHSMTPVLNREESLREWERRQAPVSAGTQGQSQGSSERAGKSRKDYQHLDALNEQAEKAHAGYGQQQWSSPGAGSGTGGYGGNLAHTSQRGYDAQLGQGGFEGQGTPINAQIAAPPPAAYASSSRHQPVLAGTMGAGGNVVGTGSNGVAAGLSFDPYQADIAQLMPALQPTQYHTVGHSAAPSSASAQARALNHQMNIAGNRHSIAIPPSMSTANSMAGVGGAMLPSSASLATLQGLYSTPDGAGGGLVPGMLLPSQGPGLATSNTARHSGGGSGDGYGGLSDLMFGASSAAAAGPGASGGGAGGVVGNHNPSGRYAHNLPPTHSPLDSTSASLPQYQGQSRY